MLSGLSRSLSMLAALALVLPVSAWANGQTTHVWIAEEALRSLEAGELKSLLSSPELRDPLLNGAMFPDGGYAVSDHYGELAHWEPFQQAYLQWIRDTFPPPWDEGDAAPHVAFLMGLAAHGLAFSTDIQWVTQAYGSKPSTELTALLGAIACCRSTGTLTRRSTLSRRRRRCPPCHVSAPT